MQDVNNMIRDILRANEENKLAIFIGAGVSANSGFKSWWQIVNKFNENKKYVDNGNKDYTDEEILKIPQFVYNEDPELYFKILEEEYNKLPDATNPIINALLELQPNHIITTNYDRLIEQSIEKQHIYGNTMYEDFSKYSRIINDTGFISAKKPHYYIKMHGDLEDRASIVLKEDDYLEFSTTHSLVETFVKSLFVNHTILFVGYGLKDNNLKLIMSWVNSFTRKNTERDSTSRYYYINVEDTELSKYDKEYYSNKNIYIIEASKIPDVKRPNDNQIVFSHQRGENLYRVARYLKYGVEMSLDDILCNIAAFETMNAITPHELYHALGLHASISCIINGIEYRFPDNRETFKNITVELQNNPDSNASNILKKSFIKAGIKGIVISEKKIKPAKPHRRNNVGLLEIFWMQQEPEYEILWLGDIEDDFYNIVLAHDFSAMQSIIYNDNDSIGELLKRAYLYSYFWDDDKAKDIYKNIDESLKKEKLSFDYITTLFNLNIHDYDERYYKIHIMMSEKHKFQFYTLMQFYDNFPELMRKAIEVDVKIRKMIAANPMIRSGDLKFTNYTTLREEIFQILKYLIKNYIFVSGLGGCKISRKWFDIIEIYLNTTFKIISPNSNMQVSSDYQYKRIELTNEDIYFLTFYLDTSTLRFYLREYNITTLNLQDDQQDFLIKLLNNVAHFDILPEQPRHSKLAKLINATMLLIGYTKINQDKLKSIFNHLEILIINLFKLDGDADYTWFYECFSHWVECIYDIVKKAENKQQIQSNIKSLVEALLMHFASSDTDNGKNMGLQIQVFMEQGLLLNMSNLLEYHFAEILDDDVLISFLDRAELYEHSTRNILSNFIIELFPAMSEEMKGKHKIYVYDRLPNLEIRYVRRALESKVIAYDNVAEQLLINSCHNRVKYGVSREDEKRFNDPIYIVARLHEQNIIKDLAPYKSFKGHDDFFDFVCFPEEFDYSKFKTDWSTWLTLEKYSTIALDLAFDALKTKYESKMLNSPTENDKHIYYKYFKS